jgi:hypothetical protein
MDSQKNSSILSTTHGVKRSVKWWKTQEDLGESLKLLMPLLLFIPKESEATSTKTFRPISLCNII